MRLCHSAIIVALLVSGGLTGCQTAGFNSRTGSNSAPVLDANSAIAAGLSTQEVAWASNLYTAKCARCHQFYDPRAYTDEEWRSWMAKMSKKAHLNEDQVQLLSRYLEAFRAKQ